MNEMLHHRALPHSNSGKPRPVIISHSRYHRILATATNADVLKQDAMRAQERARQAQLQAGGEALMRLFGNNICATNDQRIAQLRAREAEKQRQRNEEQAMFSQAEADKQEAERQARLAEAQLLIEKLRPGPRELQSAQLQTEILHAMNLQQKLQSEFAETQRQQEALDNKLNDERIQEGIRAAQQEQQKRARNAQQYKQELKALIAARSIQRADEKANELRSARTAQEACDRELAARADKERAANERKRNEVRRHGLEAMRMSEERQKREAMLVELEERKCVLHTAARTHLDQLKVSQCSERRRKILDRNQELAKEIAPQLHYSATKDNERHERELIAMRRIFSAEEKAHHARIKAVREARIETQRQEQLQANAAQQRAEAQRQQAVLQRFKNDQIHRQFQQAERCAFLKKVHDLRKVLDEQMQRRKADDSKPDINYNKNAHLEYLKEHKFFFDYAKQLIGEAKAGGYPLKPLVRAVDQYKRLHHIAADTKTPRHLVSKLTLGLRQPGDSRSDELAVKTGKRQESQEQKELSAILEDCKQIDKLIAAKQSS